MSNSVVICSGPPAVCQMRPKKEKFGTLTKITVGERNPDETNKTILLVGEKGAGKSTLINALVNYTMGVKWEDEVWLQIVEDEKRSQTESQTSDVIVYEIFDFENKTLPYSLTIIDTPGYGDTRGTEHDDIISQRLLELFESEDGIHEVHAVGLVMKVTDNQSSDRMKYIFDSVISLFGRKMEKNIAALITHSDGMPPTKLLKALEDTNIRFAKKKNGQPGYFTFNNQQNIERTEENDFGLETAWRITQRGMSEFKAFLRETTPVKPEAASVVLTECIRLTACIQNLQDRIKFTEVKEREMKQTQEALKKHEGEIRINEQLPAFDAEVYKHKESITKAAVICTVCEENCHYPGCTVPLNHCEVFKDGFCTSCSKKCLASLHVKEKSRYVTRVKKIEKKQNNESECENKSSLLENLEKEMNQLAAEKSRLLDESYQRLLTLQQNVNSVSTYVHLDFLIEKMKEKQDTEKVQKLEEMRSFKSEGTRSALQDKTSVITSPHEDIILNSFLIRSGSPAVYQLRPKKEKFGTLTRMTVGEKNPNTTNKTILFVGETGAGKSALINALINYTMGVKWEDEVWFQIVEDEKRSQTESQTSDVIVYEIFGFEDKTLPYSLTMIDTPGYGDTKRAEHDDIISQRLLDLFGSEDGVHELNSVGLVMMASDKRLSDRLMYVFNSVMSLFGKTVEKQIVALITHSDGRKPENVLQAVKAANIKCAKNEKKEPVHFLFNNCQHEERTEKDEASLQHSWDTAQKGIGHLTELLGKSRSQPLMTTVEVLKKRVRLQACIQNLQERIELVDKQQTEIKQTEDALKQNKEKMKNNENFIIEVDEVYKNYEEIKIKWWQFSFYNGQATCCTVCKENCHYPGCTMAKGPENCWVMKNGSCTVCTKKCPASDHQTEKKKYETKERRVKTTLEEMKIKYEKNKSESEKKLSLLENLKKKMTRLTAEKSQLLDESFQHVVNLEKIALNIDSVSTLVHLDFLIEKMKEKGDTEKVQKLEEMISRVDERIRAAYWYKLAQIPSAIKKIGKSLLGDK